MSDRPPSVQLYSNTEISRALDAMAATINVRCAQGEWLVICVLQGGLVMAGELLQRFNFLLKLDQIKVSRYAETTQGHDLQWHLKPGADLQGRQVLILDDIFDEGITLAALVDYCQNAGAEIVRSAVLVDKTHDRKRTEYRPDFIGLNCPDSYIFGFGMDYAGYWRNLPAIYCLT